MNLHIQTLCAAFIAALIPASAALSDDRPPNATERASIEETLTNAGYTTWEEIEFDDGQWEVDDARKEGSRVEFDIKIDPDTWASTSEREDR